MIPKFRVWDKTKQEFVLGPIITFYWADDEQHISIKDYYGDFVKEFEITYSTGLTDHNRIEIFEGDILKLNRDETWYGHVEHFIKYDCPAFDVKPPNDYHYDSNVISHELACGAIEVVGNIYENPVYSTEDGII